jgi:hypothetical protein
MSDEMTMQSAERAALKRLRERADEVYQELKDAFNEALPGNHTPADALLLAHLMTASARYHFPKLVTEWECRGTDGWGTALCFVPTIADKLTVSFAYEVRYGAVSRGLAVLIDERSPGERTAEKMARERRLLALGYRVLSFSETEIFTSVETCRDRVEAILADMSREVLRDVGIED